MLTEKQKQKQKEYAHTHYLKNKDHLYKINNAWRLAHPERIKKMHQQFYQRHKEERRIYRTKYDKEHPEVNRRCAFRYQQGLRLKALLRYSEGKLLCACCGESRYEFLTIDHVNGRQGSREESKTTYRMLAKEEYKEGFQVLCYNCNCAKGFYNGCPHKTGRSVLSEISISGKYHV